MTTGVAKFSGVGPDLRAGCVPSGIEIGPLGDRALPPARGRNKGGWGQPPVPSESC